MKPPLAILLLALVALPGCVTIPVPPIGNEQQRGSLGDLKISLAIAYLPKTPTTQTTDAGLTYAQRQFQQSLRTLHDK